MQLAAVRHVWAAPPHHQTVHAALLCQHTVQAALLCQFSALALRLSTPANSAHIPVQHSTSPFVHRLAGRDAQYPQHLCSLEVLAE